MTGFSDASPKFDTIGPFYETQEIQLDGPVARYPFPSPVLERVIGPSPSFSPPFFRNRFALQLLVVIC
jgi:hypothetical protein